MKKQVEYPDKYIGFKLKWIDNKPKFNKGDTVIILDAGVYKSITLEMVSKEPMQLKWVKQRMGCRSCKKPGSTIEVSKYVYRWNDKLFTEGAEIDIVRKLNNYELAIKSCHSRNLELSKDAELFRQLKKTLDGEIISTNDW